MLVYVAELQAIRLSDSAIVTLRYCTHPSAGKTDGNTWLPYLAVPLRRNLQLFDGEFSEQPQDYGQMEIAFSKGVPGDPLTNYGWDARPVKIWRGTAGQTTAAMTKVFDGTAVNVAGTKKRYVVTLKGPSLDKPVLSATYAGTGGIEGPAELKGTLKPMAIGNLTNVEPVCINKGLGIYQVHGYGQIGGSVVCYDSGSQLGTSTADYASYALLAAATIPAGRFATCGALGLIRVGGEVTGVFTVDVVGAVYSGYPNNAYPGAILTYLLGTVQGLSSGQYSATDLTWLDTQLPYSHDWYITDQMTVEEACRTFMLSLGGFVWYTDAGVFTVGLLRRGGVSSVNLDRKNIAEGLRLLPTSAPVYQRRQGYQRSWRVHDFSEVRTPKEVNPRGAFTASPNPVYQYYDLVDYNNSSYLYISGTAGSTALPTDTTVWQLFSVNGNAVVESASAPSSPVQGMIWRNTTTGILSWYNAGAWVTLTGALATLNNVDYATQVAGAQKPADYAGSLLNLTAVGPSPAVRQGNSISRATVGTYDSCVRGDPYFGPCFAEVDINPGNVFTIVALDTEATGSDYAVQQIILQYNPVGTQLNAFRNGVQVNSVVITGLPGKMRVAYDGERYRLWVGDREWFAGSPALLASGPNLLHYPKWYAYNTGTVYAGLNAGPYSDQKTAATVKLTAIGNLSENGSTLIGDRLTGASSDSYNYTARGEAMAGPCFAECDVIQASAYTMLSLDDDTTNFAYSSQVITVHYNYGLNALAVYATNGGGGGALLHSSAPGSISGKMQLIWDGVNIRVNIGGVQRAKVSVAGVVGLTGALYPKFTAYTANSIMTGCRYGLLSSLNFADTGGVTKPEDNATYGDNLVLNSGLTVDTSRWTGISGFTRTLASAGDPGPFFRSTFGGSGANANDGVTIKKNDGASTLSIEANIRASGANGYVQIFVYYYDASSVFISQSIFNAFGGGANVWVKRKATVTIPAKTAYYYIFIIGQNNTDTSVDIQGIRVAPTESGAQPNMNIVGPESVTVKASPTDIVETLPKLQYFKLIHGVDGDVTTQAAWAISTLAGTGTFTIGAATGVLSVNKNAGVLGGSLVEITATYQNKTVTVRVPIQIEFTLTKLLPEVGLSTSVGSARGTIQNFKQSLASGAHNQFNSVLGSNYAYVVSGPNGKINYQLDLQYTVANPNIGGYEQRMYAKYGAYPGGVLEPVIGTGSKAQTLPTDHGPGTFFATYQITGLTANTGYWVSAFECFLNVSGAPTTQDFEFWGTFSAYGE